MISHGSELLQEWNLCVNTNAAQWAQSSESATVVTEAAFAQCTDREDSFRADAQAAMDTAWDTYPKAKRATDAIVEEQKSKIRANVLASLLDARTPAPK